MTKTLAQHKSVYLCFRPLLAVCKVYGSCAIQNSFSQNAQGLRYSYRNLWLLHCLVFHVGISFMMHSTLELRRQSTPVTCFYDLRKLCFLAALLSTDHDRVDLLRGLERFDSKIHSLNKIKLLEYNPKMRGHFWHFVYHLVYTVGMNALSYTLFYPRDKTALALFFDVLVKTFAAEMVFSYTIINIVFNNELRFRYKVISASWIYHMRNFQANPIASIRMQERLRLLYAELTGLGILFRSVICGESIFRVSRDVPVPYFARPYQRLLQRPICAVPCCQCGVGAYPGFLGPPTNSFQYINYRCTQGDSDIGFA
ncbi:hypothetical protein J6590_085747 [Homalodisca vitripennis]|nr:hypothetical protein J6590_085747 [Homalodisca vitripennis]